MLCYIWTKTTSKKGTKYRKLL